MKILITNDLHQKISKWTDLVKVIFKDEPRFVLIAGDILPKAEYAAQKQFFPTLRGYLRIIQQNTQATVLTYFGNDDCHILEPELDKLEAAGLCINLNGRVHREEGLVFCGMNKCRDYPFGYKHWCAPDGDYLACPVQFGQALTFNVHGDRLPIENLEQYLAAKTSIGQELKQLKHQLADGEMRRSIWMIHQPPANLEMDICLNCERVGSPAVHQFAVDNQPLLGCSGHIHESPHMRGGRWIAKVANTTWLQPGQYFDALHYVTLEITGDFQVANASHSVFDTTEPQTGGYGELPNY